MSEGHGFVRIGIAPRYLRIAGTWQDHAMYQVLDPAADDASLFSSTA